MEDKPNKNLYHAYIMKAQDCHTWEKDIAQLSGSNTIPVIFEEFVTMWTVSGPVRIYKAKSYIRKSIWLILWLLCFGYCSYQCYNTYQEYQKFEKSVTIDVVDVETIEFPAVTFCTLSPLSPESIDWYKNRSSWYALYELQQTYGGSGHCSTQDSSFIGNPSKSNSTGYDGSTTTLGKSKRSAITEKDFFGFLDDSSQRAGHALSRVRRSIDILTAPTKFLNLSDDEILSIRINCSLKYQRFLFQSNLMMGNDQPPTLFLGKRDQCKDLANYEKSEKLYYDPLCIQPVVLDAYGFYSTSGTSCNPLKKGLTGSQEEICSTCCQDANDPVESCASITDYNSFSDLDVIHSEDALEKIVKFSQTSDGIDMSSKFTIAPEDIESSSGPISQVIRTCSFDTSSCSPKDFEVWNSYKYGRCYTFNSNFIFNKSKIASVKKNGARNTRAFGPKNGLRLTIDINSKEILSLLSPEIGIRVLFHKSDTMPFPEDEGINVSPGVSTSIQITMEQIQRQQAPWGKCAVTDLQTQYNYTQIACQKICLEKNYRNKCSCYVGMGPAFAHLPMPEGKEQCSLFNITQNLCTDEILFSYYQGDLNCSCPLSCNEWNYDSTITSSDTDMKYYRIIQNIKQQSVGDDICSGSQNGTVRLQVFLKALSFSQITENQAYSFETLVSNIGGSLGLFVGASVISCLELIELLVNILLHYIWKRKNQSGKREPRAPIYILHEQTGDQDLGYVKHDQKDLILTSFFSTNQEDMGKMEKANKAFGKMLFT